MLLALESQNAVIAEGYNGKRKGTERKKKSAAKSEASLATVYLLYLRSHYSNFRTYQRSNSMSCCKGDVYVLER